MDARKLVGMTEGAKKRAALYESLHNQDTGPEKLTNCEARMVWANVCNMVAHSRPWREQVRKSYRIGQRLRPCPGCAECGAGKSGRIWRLRLGDQLWISGSLRVKDPAHICDRSGVLPARARKVRHGVG